MWDSGPDLVGERGGVHSFLRRWSATLDRSAQASVVLRITGGTALYVNPVAAGRFGHTPTLQDVIPDVRQREILCEALDAPRGWEGEAAGGTRVVAVPILGDNDRAAAVYIELTEGPLGHRAVSLTHTQQLTEYDVRRLRRALKWRDAEHAVAMAMGEGCPFADLAVLALDRLARVIPYVYGRITLIDGDSLRQIAARGAAETRLHPTLLIASPAHLSRSLRAPVQRVVADALDEFPALGAAHALGIRAISYTPLEVAETVFGFIELSVGDRDQLAPDEIELLATVARVLATARARERALEQAIRQAQAMETRVALGREELDRTNEQLLQAAKLSSIGELAAGLVHELNQPLNVLGGYVELLQERSLTGAAQERALKVMARAVERMGSLVDNLRNFSRGAGPLSELVEIDVVVQMARELTVGALKRGVAVDCPFGLTVRGDANRLEQVLVNLLANALQSEGDPVAVRALLDGDQVIVEVSDRGPGVPEALRSRIFEAFFTTKPAGQGTGLGLSVSARIVQEHGGRMEVADNPGGGAIFRVILPYHRRRGGELPS